MVTNRLTKKLEEEIAKQRFNYKSLSLAAGLGETTVRDIITGRARNPRWDTLQKIAHTLGLPLSHFLTEDSHVPVTDTGKRSRSRAGAVREHEQGSSFCDSVETPPELGYRDIAAVRLRGDAMLPFLPEGTVLYYQERKQGRLDAFLGKLCVAQLKGGALTTGILEQGSIYGCYNLAHYNARTQKNAEIEWGAKYCSSNPYS